MAVHAVTQVLINPTLLHQVTAFILGVPHFVV